MFVLPPLFSKYTPTPHVRFVNRPGLSRALKTIVLLAKTIVFHRKTNICLLKPLFFIEKPTFA